MRYQNLFLAIIACSGVACADESNDLLDSGDPLFEDEGDADDQRELWEDDAPDAERIGVNDRYSVVQEAFYALNRAHTGSSSKRLTTGGGTWTASDWNYLNSDTRAFSTMTSRYGAYSSNYYPGSASSWGQTSSGYGRGGQCKFFANLLLYRAGVDTRTFPSYSTWRSSYRGTKASCAQKGDIIWRSSGGSTGHVAVVVDILAGNSASCTVTEVDVVDSNQDGTERILRHKIDNRGTYFGEDLDNYYVYTGTSYYRTAYAAY